MKKLIHVSCTSAYKYPERPLYLLIRGKKYDVDQILQTAQIQSVDPPFNLVHYFKVRIAAGDYVEIEYHQKTKEWYLLDYEKYDFL